MIKSRKRTRASATYTTRGIQDILAAPNRSKLQSDFEDKVYGLWPNKLVD